MLLPLAGRPMLDYLVDRIEAVDEIDEIHVVTNARFAGDLGGWASQRSGCARSRCWNDGTTSNEDRLGAIGDIRFTIEQAGLGRRRPARGCRRQPDRLQPRGVRPFLAGKDGGSALSVHRVPDSQLIKQYGVVELDDDDRVVSLEEKPSEPRSDLAATAAYLYPAEHAALIGPYLDERNPPDAPGNFVVWLHQRAPVYGYRFEGEWMDIGDPEQLLEADNRMRVERGLEPRAEYSLTA